MGHEGGGEPGASVAAQASALSSLLQPVALLLPRRDEAGTIVDFQWSFLNDAGARAIGSPVKGGITGSLLLERLPGLRTGLFGDFVNVVATGRSFQTEGVWMDQPWQDVTSSRVFTVRAVRVDGALSLSWNDDTDRVTAEQALQRNEESFRRAMRDSGVAMCLIGADGVVVAANAALTTFLGHDVAGLKAMDWEDVVHPFDAPALRQGINQVLARDIDSHRATVRFVRSDEAVVVGDLTLSAIRNPLLGLLVVQIIDITEQARIAKDLAESEELHRLLADNATDVVARGSNEGVIQWISGSVTNALGWHPDELKGQLFLDLVHPDDVLAARSGQAHLRVGSPARFEARLRNSEGGYGWFSITASAILNDAGDAIGRAGSWRNIDREVAARTLAATREAEHRLLAENASDLVLRVGADHSIEWVSPSVEAMLGWRPDQLLGRSPDDFLTQEDAGSLTAAPHRRVDEPTRQSVRFRGADGTYRWFATVATRITDTVGHDLGLVIGMSSIDAEVSAMQALSDSEDRFRTAMAAAPGGMAVVDLDRRFLEVNQALAVMVGRDRQWLLQHGVGDVMSRPDDRTDMAWRDELRTGRVDTIVKESRLLRSDGTTVWVQHAIGLLHDQNGEPKGYVSQFVDISVARKARQELEYFASHDPLTRLANRHALVSRMRHILSHRPRGGRSQGVLFLDLDGLKQVNDRYGHTAGDELIVNVADRIRRSVRNDDHVARLGGDEFVVLLPSVGGMNDVIDVGDKIRSSIAANISLAQATVTVTASAGATLVLPGDEPEEAIERADRALYRAKTAGRDRTVAFDPELD